eukprot:1801-Heterococcus_DN1.PRE.5
MDNGETHEDTKRRLARERGKKRRAKTTSIEKERKRAKENAQPCCEESATTHTCRQWLLVLRAKFFFTRSEQIAPKPT